jgi:hypothetical protein
MSEEAGPTRLRASDPEREEYAKLVRDAVGEGRLSLGEGDERLAQVYAARFVDELAPLVADLPRPQPPATRHPYHPYQRGLVGRHLGAVVFVSAILIGIWALSGAHFFWPAIPLIFLTLGVFRHARYAAWRRGARYYR